MSSEKIKIYDNDKLDEEKKRIFDQAKQLNNAVLGLDGSMIPENDPNKKYKRFESKIYKWLKANAEEFGFKNPSKLGPKSNTPEAWHWENIEIRNKLYDFKKPVPGYVNSDGVEINPEDMES